MGVSATQGTVQDQRASANIKKPSDSASQASGKRPPRAKQVGQSKDGPASQRSGSRDEAAADRKARNGSQPKKPSFEQYQKQQAALGHGKQPPEQVTALEEQLTKMREEQARLVAYADKLNQENAQLDYMATMALQANAEKDKLIKAGERAEGDVSEKDQKVENIVLEICTRLEKVIQAISSSCQGAAVDD